MCEMQSKQLLGVNIEVNAHFIKRRVSNQWSELLLSLCHAIPMHPTCALSITW